MSIYYFNSAQIQVFPCANRSADEASRFTTEYNLTHLGNCRTEIISSTAMSQGSTEPRLIQCWVKGYYFKFICDPTTQGFPTGDNLYLQINISDTSGLQAWVANQGKLISFDTTKALDSENKFYGARLTDGTPNSASLLLKKNGTWQKAGPAYLRLLSTDNNIYRITVESDGTIKATKESS